MSDKTSAEIRYAPPAIVARGRITPLIGGLKLSDPPTVPSDGRLKTNVTPVTWNDEPRLVLRSANVEET